MSDEVDKTAEVGGGVKFDASQFVHLHNHTHFSLLDGLTKMDKLVARVKDLGMDAIAITDHGTLSGAIEFYQACKKENIKPIIGIETYVANRKHTDKDPTIDKARFHLILLAMNNKGYQNIMKLSTVANLDGFYHKPRIDHDLLEKYNEGVIALSGCINGEVADALRSNQYEEAKKRAQWYKDVFGDRYYLEIQDHQQWDEQRKVNKLLLQLSQELKIPAVVTGDAHYLTHEDQEAHELLLCVQTGSLLNDEKRMSLKDTDLFVSNPQDIASRWPGNLELLTNTKQIADRCDISIELGKILIPTFPTPGDHNEKSYLNELVWLGLAWRYGGKPYADAAKLSEKEIRKLLNSEIIERAEYELGIISHMGFDGYFLIVQDFINWGKKQGIVFGPGRGSAAGSIISYALNITDLDPMRYDLLFERFLNPDRISMPDIDIDIQDSRRDEVIQYCVDKYGQEQVAHIVTYGTMAGRAAIRDVARVLDVPYAEADRLAKLVPPPIQGRHIPLSDSIKKDPDFKNEYENSQTAKRVIDLAIKLEGTIRSHGVHAAGVVIAPDNIVKFAPLEMAQKGVVTTQYAMGPIDQLGLLKIDFLGLSNLTIVNNALRIIKKVHKEDINISSLPLDDEATYQLLGKGDTTGVFQLESNGMKRYLRELKPTVFEDVVAMGALYRPGPLTAGLTNKFIDRKNGKEKVSYDHPLMEAALKDTYGVMVYQEQFMQIVRDMCGFTGGESDTLRKAVGKKKRDLMAKMKHMVISGAEKKGVPKAIAEKFWKDLEGFADYAFNKSHAACYGLISYWTAYLKAHYPECFMAALMTSDFDDTDRLTIEITEARHMGLKVLAPDVNESFLEFAVVPATESKDLDTIRYGMAAIKNVGKAAVEEIIRAREKKKFDSIADFAERVSQKAVNRKAWESLIKAGAFDALEPSRATLLSNIDVILAFAGKIQKEAASGQTDLFGNSVDLVVKPQLDLVKAPNEIPEREQLQWERELLGVFLSSHPLDPYETYLYEQTVALNQLKPTMDNKKVTVGGMITSIKEINTKNGSKMAFATIADMTSEVELIIFPGSYEDNKETWVNDNVVQVTGKINTKDRDGRLTEEVKIIVNEANPITLEEVKEYQPTGKQKSPPKPKKEPASISDKPEQKPPAKTVPLKLYIHLTEPDDNEKLLALKQLLNKYPGGTEVIVVIDRSSRQAIRLPDRVNPQEELIQGLSQLYSPDAVALK